MKNQLIILFICLVSSALFGQQKTNPSFEDILSLQSIRSPVISPDGKHVIFHTQSTDWEENRYDTELWIAKNGGTPFQLTNNPEGNSSNPRWSPDGDWIAFESSRKNKNQIYAMRSAGGEAFQVTSSETGINDYEWSPDGKTIAFTKAEDKSKSVKKRKDTYGEYAVEDQEYSMTELWTIPFLSSNLDQKLSPSEKKDTTLKKDRSAQLLIEDADFSINNFKWSPDGKNIAITHQPDPLRNSFFKADISIYNLETKSLSALVSNPSFDGFLDWSPDGKSILYGTALDNTTSVYYLNTHIFRINLDKSNNKELAAEFDEEIGSINWTKNGIFGIARQKTKRHIIKIDPNNGSTSLMMNGIERVNSLSITEEGLTISISGDGQDMVSEIFLGGPSDKNLKKLSNSSRQIQNMAVADGEVIEWKSKDGATIEGVLLKPQDYDPNRKYPLLVAIHGGPTGTSVPSPIQSYVYPINQWLNKGALVLMPNYRGSAGYGEKFRSLNVRNLGVGDAWDVLSGVDYLEKQGLIDGDKVGCMGWSQGGYISAFLSTNSDKFKALSVGAGISNWMTYYVNTDIHPFTRQYLKGTPWSDKEVYEKTSPMTNINQASTPTLIQHGEFDQRVPPANAFELFQGLQDVGVETELIIYKGFGHGITKPKERLAAVWHNWKWFGKYIWGEDIEIPIED